MLLSVFRIKLLKSLKTGFVLQEKHTFKMQMLSLIYATVDDLGLIQRSLNSIGDFLQTSVGLNQHSSPHSLSVSG